jgi:hypothetical protein
MHSPINHEDNEDVWKRTLYPVLLNRAMGPRNRIIAIAASVLSICLMVPLQLEYRSALTRVRKMIVDK